MPTRVSSLFHRTIYLRDLLRELVVRDMKIRYKRSVLGLAWSLLNPLLQLAVFWFVFRVILPLSIPNYALFLFTGILAWNWFHSSVQLSSSVIVDNPGLIRQPGFPAAILPVVTVTANLVNFLLALPVLLLALLTAGYASSWTVVALPLVIGIQFLLTLGLSYLLATLHVSFRDTQYLLGVLLMLGFYLVPIFYDVQTVPAAYRDVYALNPLVPIIDAYRAVLIRGQWPAWSHLAAATAFSVVLLWWSLRQFVRASHRFVEEL